MSNGGDVHPREDTYVQYEWRYSWHGNGTYKWRGKFRDNNIADWRENGWPTGRSGIHQRLADGRQSARFNNQLDVLGLGRIGLWLVLWLWAFAAASCDVRRGGEQTYPRGLFAHTEIFQVTICFSLVRSHLLRCNPMCHWQILWTYRWETGWSWCRHTRHHHGEHRRLAENKRRTDLGRIAEDIARQFRLRAAGGHAEMSDGQIYW